MSRFFIDRPIFAWVIALVVMLTGTLAILKLPITQYPNIAPPAMALSVRASAGRRITSPAAGAFPSMR